MGLMTTGKKPLLVDRYEEWLKLREVKPARRAEWNETVPDLYEAWLSKRIKDRMKSKTSK